MTVVPYKHNTLPGLGFRLFGKNITLGGIVTGIIGTAVSIATNLVRVIPVVGDIAADYINEKWKLNKGRITHSIDQWFASARTGAVNVIGEADFTDSEAAIVNFWSNNKFIPWVKSVTSELAAAVALTDVNAKLAGINAVADKINAVQDHYAVAEKDGLSETAVDLRALLIYQTLEALNQVIMKVVEDTGAEAVATAFKPSKYNYAPLFSTTPITTVPTENYRLQGGTLPVSTTPTTTIPTTTTIKTPIRVIQAVDDATLFAGATKAPITIKTPIVVKPATPAETKSNTGLIVGGIALTGIVLYAFRKKKKS